MSGTTRALVVAAVLSVVSVGGVGWFLGFDPVASLLAGLVAAALAVVLIAAAARRAESFAGGDELTPPTPRHPGPPDPPSADDGA